MEMSERANNSTTVARFKEAADEHKSATDAYHKSHAEYRYRKIEVDCAK
jgi:hypothetical protein